MSERYTVRGDQTAAQEIDGEAVVINFETYHYYSLNRTGTAIWKLLQDGSRERAELSAALAVAFNQLKTAVAADVDALLDALLAEGLVHTTETAAALPASIDLAGEYVPPRVDKHEKLDQLMLSGE